MPGFGFEFRAYGRGRRVGFKLGIWSYFVPSLFKTADKLKGIPKL